MEDEKDSKQRNESSNESNEIKAKKENDENQADKSEPKVYLRFYHVFENSELESLLNLVPNTRIVESFYEQGNWCVVFEKLHS